MKCWIVNMFIFRNMKTNISKVFYYFEFKSEIDWDGIWKMENFVIVKLMIIQ